MLGDVASCSYQNKADVSAFEYVLKQCRGGTIVVVDMGSGTSPCSRAWCLYGKGCGSMGCIALIW